MGMLYTLALSSFGFLVWRFLCSTDRRQTDTKDTTLTFVSRAELIPAITRYLVPGNACCTREVLVSEVRSSSFQSRTCWTGILRSMMSQEQHDQPSGGAPPTAPPLRVAISTKRTAIFLFLIKLFVFPKSTGV